MTRRGWLAIAGIGLGGFAAGYAIRLGLADGGGTVLAAPISGRLAHALDLARAETPIETLVAQTPFLVSVTHELRQGGRDEPALWRAHTRIIHHVLAQSPSPGRRAHAVALLDLLSHPHPPELDRFADDLKQARR